MTEAGKRGSTRGQGPVASPRLKGPGLGGMQYREPPLRESPSGPSMSAVITAKLGAMGGWGVK